MFRTSVALATALAAVAATPAAAQSLPGTDSKSGSVSARINALAPIVIEAPLEVCLDADDASTCTPASMATPFSMAGGVLRLDYVVTRNARVASSVARCGTEPLQGASIALSTTSSELSLRSTFTPDGAASPSQDTGWRTVTGRKVGGSTELC